MELRSRLVRGAGIATAGFVLSRGIQFGAFVVLASLIEPRDAGQLAAGTVLVGAALLFSEGGMLSALIQWREESNLDRAASTAFVSTLLTGVLLVALAVASAPLLGIFFDDDTVTLVAMATSGWLFLRALQVVPDALLQRRFSFVRRVVIDPLGAVAFAVAAIVACSHGLGVWGLVIGTYAQYTLQLIAAWTFARWRPHVRDFSWTLWRQLISFARHVIASEIVRRLTVELDTIVLGRAAGAGPLGQYRYGKRLATFPTEAWVSVAAYVLLPGFARIAEDVPRLRRAFLDSLTAMSTVSLPASLLLLPLGDELAMLAFGPQWSQAGTAVKALAAIGIGHSVASIVSEVFKAAGRPELLTRMHTVALVASLILLPSLAWAEVSGVALAVSLVALIQGGYGLWLVGPVVGASFAAIVRRLRGLVIASALALVATLLLDVLVFGEDESRAGTLVPLSVEAAAMAVVFLASALLLARDDLRSMGALLSALRRRRSPA